MNGTYMKDKMDQDIMQKSGTQIIHFTTILLYFFTFNNVS